MQGAGDGRGGHGERIDIHLELAELLLDADAELLLLVNDEQAQVLELDVLAQDAVGTDEDVHLACGQSLDDGLRLGGGAGAAQVLHAAGQVFQALLERLEVLVGKDGGGHQDGHLLVVARGLEGGAHGHFRLTKAHVAAHQAIHRSGALHVGLHVGRSLALVGRVFVEERGFELALQEAVGAELIALLLAALRVEADEVAGDVLDFLLRAVLQLLPRTRAQLVEAGRFALLALVLGHLVEGVDGDEHHVVVLIDKLDDLLRGVAVGDAHQAGKATYAVVGVHHVVARLELVEFLQREGYLAAARLVALEVVLVEAVEQLVVGEDAQAQLVVGKAFVQGLLHRRKGDLLAPALLEDGTDAVGLLGAVATDIDGIAVGQIAGKAVGHEVEVLVEDGLRRRVELKRSVGRACGLGAELQAAEVEGTDGELAAVDELAFQTDVTALLRLAGGDGLGCQGFVVHLLDAFAQPQEVAHGQDGVGGQEVEERHHAARAACREVIAEVGHDDHALLLLLGQLRLHLEGAQALHLVAEEVDAEGVFAGEGKYVDDAASDGILAGFIDIVGMLKAVAVEHLGDERHVHLLAHVEGKRLLLEFTLRHHLLGQRVGEGDDAQAAAVLLQTAEHLGAEDFVGGVLLAVLDGAAEGRREEEHLPVAQHLHQVVVEVTRLLAVAQHKDERATCPPHQHRGHQGSRRAVKPAHEEVFQLVVGQQAQGRLDLRMGGVSLLQFGNRKAHVRENYPCKITKKMDKNISAAKKSTVFLLKKQWKTLHLWHIYNP